MTSISAPIMSIVDGLIFLIILITFVYAYYNRQKIQFGRAIVPSILISLGLLALGLFAAFDFARINNIFDLFPEITLTEISHSNDIWSIQLIATGLIVFGVVLLGSRLTATNTELEQRISRRTAELFDSTTALKHSQKIASLGSYSWDIESGDINWSDEQYSIFGLTPGIKPMNFAQFQKLVHPDDRNAVKNAIRSSLEDNNDYNAEFRIVRPDGVVRHVNSRAIVIRDDAGKPLRMLGTNHDITVQKQKEQQYSLVLNNLADGAISIDTKGTISYVNPMIVEMFGYSEEELIGQNVKTLMPELDMSQNDGYLSTYHKTGEAIVSGKGRRVDGQRKDGTEFPLDIKFSETIVDGITTFFGTLRDITERVQTEEIILREKLNAETSNRVKSEFLANMSHELRTPLNAIIGFSDLMSGEKFGPLLNKKQDEYLNYIRDSGHHLLKVINDILDVSAIEADRLEMSTTEVNINDTVETSLLLVRTRAIDEGVQLVNNLNGHCPTICADERRMKQIMVNLLSNAVKFTKKGGTVTVDAKSNKNGMTVISVTDTGIGMTAEELTIAMEPFRQIIDPDKNTNEGTGLGLPLTKKLTEAQGGKFTLKSTPGSGTIAMVEFPKSENSTAEEK